MKIKLIKFKSVKSTNDIAIQLIKKKKTQPNLITSKKQTKEKQRRANANGQSQTKAGKTRKRGNEREGEGKKGNYPNNNIGGENGEAARKDKDYAHAGVTIAIHKMWLGNVEEVREIS